MEASADCLDAGPGRARRRCRRRTVLLGLVLAVDATLASTGLGCGHFPADRGTSVAGGSPTGSTGRPAAGSAAPRSGPADPDVGGHPTGYPVTGPGTFGYAQGIGQPVGGAGGLLRYRVAVEDGIGQDVGAFAATVDRILGDPRSWTASRRIRLQRVPGPADAEFTIYLATPATSERMCAEGGLNTARFTSCRLPGQVIINLARWSEAVPGYGAPLDRYRAYVVNHEVGHELGEGHEACPGPGAPAPVMQQQTYGLDGCVANPWPYLAGERYSGPPVP